MTARRRPPITDPRVRALVRAARTPRGNGLSRRGFLLGAVGAAGVGALLAACGTDEETAEPAVVDRSEEERLLRWANWVAYLDEDDDGAFPSLQAFEGQSGIRVEYSTTIEDNESFYALVEDRLAAGADIGYDIVTVTDYLAARLIRLGYAQRLDKERIPHAENLAPGLKGVDFDLGRSRSLTWQSGFAGIAWDKEALPRGLRSVSDLWAPELEGQVSLLSEMRDTMGLLMLEEGVDPSGTWGNDEFYGALEVFREKVESGHVREVVGNSYMDSLASGASVAAIAWSGDITELNAEHGDRFEFVIPEAGGTLWSDNLVVPVGSAHRSNAEDLMDYYYQPDVAAQVAAFVNYISPVEGAQEAMLAIDPELAEDPMLFPDDETLRRVSVFRTLEPDEDERFSNEFFAAAGL